MPPNGLYDPVEIASEVETTPRVTNEESTNGSETFPDVIGYIISKILTNLVATNALTKITLFDKYGYNFF